MSDILKGYRLDDGQLDTASLNQPLTRALAVECNALQARVDELKSENSKLLSQREGFDCSYAGRLRDDPYLIHCPPRRPCQKHRLENLQARVDELERMIPVVTSAGTILKSREAWERTAQRLRDQIENNQQLLPLINKALEIKT